MTDITENEIEFLKSKLKQLKMDFTIPIVESVTRQLEIEEKIEKLK